MNFRRTTIILFSILLLRIPASPFEKNSLHRDSREWSTLSTRHFDLHYPAGMEEMALKAAELAERGYIRVSNYLGHEMKSIIPVKLYPAGNGRHRSPSSEVLNEIYDTDCGDPGDTIVTYFNGSYADLQNSITHRMVHVFQYSIAGESPFHLPGITSTRIPFWIAEGMARYIASGFDEWAEMWFRDIIHSSGYAGVRDLSDMNVRCPEQLSREGQAFIYFIDKQYGKETIGEILRDFRDTGFLDDALPAATGKSVEELDREFALFLMEHYKEKTSHNVDSKNRINPIVVPVQNQSGIMIPAISPDGTKIAALTIRDGQSDLLIFETGSDKRIKRKSARTLLKGSGCAGLKPIQGNDNRISWSREGRNIVLAVLSTGRECLVFLDSDTGRIVSQVPMPFNAIKHPSISSDGRYIAFTGVAGAAEDIYLFEVQTHKIIRITDDNFSDRYPVVTPDGRSIIFSTNWNDRGDPAHNDYYIHQIEIATGKRTVLIENRGRNIQPDLSPDGKNLIYVSDRTGVFNIHLYNFSTRKISRLTDASTGVFNPRWVPGGTAYTFTIFNDQRFDISMKDIADKSFPDTISRESYFSPATYHESYVKPSEYAFNNYRPAVKPEWLQLGSAGTMNNSYLCYLQSGLSDYLGHHQLALSANYIGEPKTNDVNATLTYNYRIRQLVLGFGIIRQSNPLNLISPDKMEDRSPYPSFGIISMEHYAGFFSARYQWGGFFNLLFETSAGRYEKKYPDSEMRHVLHMNFGKLSVTAEYNALQKGFMVPIKGFRGHVSAEQAFDFTGRNSFTRIGIDVRHFFLIGRKFMVALRGAGATLIGRNNGNFQYYLGGYTTLRGYDLNLFSGRNMFLCNAELRFTPVDWHTFGMPRHGGLGNIGAVIFFDAGSAWSGMYRLIDKKTGRFDDFKMDFGVGIRAAISRVLILKLDFAWPFDKKSIKQNDILFSIGFDY